MKLYTAVIEWGEKYDDQLPALIMSASRDDMRAKVWAEVAGFAGDVGNDELSRLTDVYGSDWHAFVTNASDIRDAIFITEYERDV